MEKHMYAFRKLRPPEPKRIVILRALQLGDLLNAVPDFRALKAAFPNSHIALVGLRWSEEFVERFHSYLDEFIYFPGIPGFPEQPPDFARWPSFLNAMQARHFDLAIQMQGSGNIANTLISLWGQSRMLVFICRDNIVWSLIRSWNILNTSRSRGCICA
jgi:ADP-heptose:LPS heptosyltransferase